MIAEPYICIKGTCPGEILWQEVQVLTSPTSPRELKITLSLPGEWQPYADFEREKLRALRCFPNNLVPSSSGYHLAVPCAFKGMKITKSKHYGSNDLVGFHLTDYCDASESSRLLKRAEFLKAVCEKEGVEWLPKEEPKEKCCTHEYLGHINQSPKDYCPCDCHRAKEKCDRFPTWECRKCWRLVYSTPTPDPKDSRFWFCDGCKPPEPEARKKKCICDGIETDGPGITACGHCGRDMTKPAYYSRAEIDERIKALLDALDVIMDFAGCSKDIRYEWYKRIRILRSRFLS